jgi:hypothetical protein
MKRPMVIVFLAALREGLFVAAALAVSLAVFVPWLGFDYRLEPRKSALNDYSKARVPDMIYGRAHRPFVQRTLVPSTIRVVRLCLPRRAVNALRSGARAAPLFLRRKLDVLGWEPEYFAEYILAMPLLFGLLLGFPFALRSLFHGLYVSVWGGALGPLLATALLPVLFFDKGTHYLYDFSTLLLFTLALGALARRRMSTFYLVFVLGCLNKETMILATLAFILGERSRSASAMLRWHVLAQVGLFAAAQVALHYVFADNPGGAVEWHLVENLRLMRTLPAGTSVLLLVSSAFLALARFREAPVFLRRSAVLVVPLLASYLFFGIYGEVRVFYEVYPALFLLAFHSACSGLGLHLTPREAAPRPEPSSTTA